MTTEPLPLEGRTVALVSAGTYDGALLGVDVRKVEVDGEEGYELKQVFGFASHLGAVKVCCAGKGGLLATGGTDEAIRLYDTTKRQAKGSLDVHESSVTALAATPSGQCILSGGADGKISLTRLSDCRVLKSFRAHSEGGVEAIAIHPSGRLALSAGAGELRMWDLTRGTCAAVSKFTEPIRDVKWVTLGEGKEGYAIMMNRKIQVLSVSDHPGGEGSSLPAPYESDALLSSMCFVDGRLIAGKANGCLVVLRVATNGDLVEESTVDPADGDDEEEEEESSFAHGSRVKGVMVAVDEEDLTLVVTVCSDGRFILWQLAAGELAGVASVDSGCRITSACTEMLTADSVADKADGGKAGGHHRRKRRSKVDSNEEESPAVEEPKKKKKKSTKRVKFA
ncbi:WD-repeat protein, putative [Perkinsus marinus ATCC 50983]|uniref:WD-repeat protein, putative n=1 Tax=Perkinsus marinus (strain ATCC 50983 / TXsc) TaxID=423536 RepID=C5L4K0_PERM5|nr:WD-repeat protein, putative [Perkinsus marinus ATCC 50983]EER08331.1 WD-repeat protein, putative [Perkinsus marinus ATCC 50983]|eukprot:XP_002776515.1 WD-repeat protein, putative [Perkinsus marinus ATCC 50983]